MGKSERRKGATAERELAKILFDELGIELKRNLDQTRDGGYDLVGLDLAIEVKRRESESRGSWWVDAVKKAGKKIPVLAYRSNRRPWQFMLPLEAVIHGHHFSGNLVDTATLYTSGFCYWVRENWDQLTEKRHG